MTTYRNGVAVTTTLTLGAGFVISGWSEQLDQS